MYIPYGIVGNDFDKALNTKLRFEYNGLISTEDLYLLTPEELNELYQKYALRVNENETESLISNHNENSEDKLRLGIIRHVFEAKQKTLKKQSSLRDKEETKHKLLEVIRQKQQEELADKSIDELTEMINNL